MSGIFAREEGKGSSDGVCQFPAFHSVSRAPTKRQSEDVKLEGPNQFLAICLARGVPCEQLLRAAWALVLLAYTGSHRPGFRFLSNRAGRENAETATESWCCVDLSRDQSPAALIKNAVAKEKSKPGRQDSRIALTWNYAREVPDEVRKRDVRLLPHRSNCRQIDIYVRAHIDGLGVKLRLHYRIHILSRWQAMLVADLLAHNVLQLTQVSPGELVDMVSPSMVRQLMAWNGRQPTLVSRCVHDLVLDQCHSQAEAMAVCAWDGDLTYADLERVSAIVAADLSSRGVGPETFVGVYFEKSKWALVAMLSVLRAGAAFVLLEPSLPQDRLGNMCAQLGAVATISAANLAKQAEAFGRQVIVLDRGNVERLRSIPAAALPKALVAPHDAAFAVFTSGSTGAPKGIVIEHSSFCSGQTEAIKAIGLSSESRVLQFSSYTFDASVAEHLTPLLVGGCVCIPSEADRASDLANAVQLLRANTLLVPATVARLLRPSDVPSVTTLVLGGESLTPSDVNTWADRVRVFNGYGPAECCVYSSIHSVTDSQDPNIIGSGTGALCWVVDPTDHGKLAPLGAVGELLIEGPIVARGYVGLEGMNRRSFVDSPGWRSAFMSSELPKYRSRMYRTGDLVQYVEGGNLRYVGRRDTQVKIHGQRLELGEVEHHMRQVLPAGTLVLADVIVPAVGSSAQVLVGFTFTPGTAQTISDSNLGASNIFHSPGPESREVSRRVVDRLAACLPRFMVPSAVIPLRLLPTTSTNKTDRRSLREAASKMARTDLFAYVQAPQDDSAPPTHMEAVLCRLVEKALRVQDARPVDDFFGIGGDSLSAIELARLAREEGLVIPVTKVFKTPRLTDLAASMSLSLAETDVPPFSLVCPHKTREGLLEMAAKACRVSAEQIEDIYPCTPLQEGLMAQSLTGAEPKYIARYVHRLPRSIEEGRLQSAWSATVEANQILRTRIIHELNTSLQVVVTTGIEWEQSHSMDASLDISMKKMEAGRPLLRLILVKERENKYFIFSIHHALYDGWSLPRILEQVEAAYHGGVPGLKPFKYFVRHTLEKDDTAWGEHWRRQLDDYAGHMFPAPRQGYTPGLLKVATRSLALNPAKEIRATPATIIQLAWAVVIAQYAGTDDVVFGTTLVGRNAPVQGIEEMLGPTLATIPLRCRYDRSSTVRMALEQLASQNADTMLFEHVGLQRIAALGASAAAACRFQNHVIIQPHHRESRSILFCNKVERYSTEIADQYMLSLEVFLGERPSDTLDITATYDPEVITPWLMERIMNQFCHCLHGISSNPENTLAELLTANEQDVQLLFGWNRHLVEPFNGCVHDIVFRHCVSYPHDRAVHAWDGSLTYRDLGARATGLCDLLQDRGIRPGQYVMVIVERSLWAVVAMLAVMKAGAAFIMIDPSTPMARLQQIRDDVDSKVVITSTSHAEKAKALGLQSVLAEQSESRPLDTSSRPAAVTPFDPVYAVFTSGSTGRPKGVIMQHCALATAAMVNSGTFLIDRNSRVLSFASFTFDASIAEILYPLVRGGCICIPSEKESRTDVEKAINDYKVTWATLTPSLARTLRPGNLNTLHILALGGEAIAKSDCDMWEGKVCLMNGYGPTECCIDAVIQPHATLESGVSNIGWGAGAACWIVDPKDSSILTPPGAVGELLIEGPILAKGYLNDAEMTEASFTSYSNWLRRLRRGRQGRVYKTGDLVRYSPSGNGSLLFLGRKDNQVKLRGQRIELGEVEQHVRESLPTARQVVAEVVSPGGESTNMKLAVFVLLSDTEAEDTERVLGALDASVKKRFGEVERQLRSRLLSYMVPSLFLPLARVPLAPTGKVNRQLLRETVSALPKRELLAYSSSATSRPPVTPSEVAVQVAVCEALGLPAEAVGMDNNFFHLGGDSIAAMKVVGRLNGASYSLSVADLFRCPRLSALALFLGHPVTQTPDTVSPFELTDCEDRDCLIAFVARACGVGQDSVEDIYSCTSMQEGLLALSMKRQGHFVAKLEFSLPRGVCLNRMLLAWRAVYDANPILRTRLVLGPAGDSTLQVVIAEELQWSSNDGPLDVALGKPLQRIKLVKRGEEDSLQLWLHHALYDGASLSLILRQAEAAYNGDTLSLRPFNTFVAYVKSIPTVASREFWNQELRDLDATMFPAQRGTTKARGQRRSVSHDIRIRDVDGMDATLSASLQLACSIVLGHYTASDDVVYGLTLSGRNAPMLGIDQCVGPTITTVPFRVRLSEAVTVEQAAMAIQRHIFDMTPHEQLGLQSIRSISADTAAACDFHTQLVIQPADRGEQGYLFKEAPTTDDVYSHFANTPLLIILSISPDNRSVHLTANFDESYLEKVEVLNLAHQLDHVVQQVMRSPSTATKDIEVISPQDMKRIMQSNTLDVISADRLLHDLVLEQCRLHPNKEAISSWDGSLTYTQLCKAFGRLSQHLTSHGAGAGSITAICMEKSRWTVVATLAVLKSGSACVPLDPSHPPGRFEEVLKQTQASVVIASQATRSMIEALNRNAHLVTVSPALLDTLPPSPPETPRQVAVTDAAFILFTSGSTGKPKGIVLEHGSIATALRELDRPLNLSAHNRTLHFASYAFDISLLEVFACLTFGGCLCIPSHEERLSDLNGFIERKRVNWAFMIPSTSHVLEPSLVPSLNTLVFGGENLRSADVERWASSDCRLINGYGPAECTPLCVTCRVDPRNYASGMLGSFATGVGWIVSPSDPSRLCAWGAVGELLIEGPIVARGYFNDAERTASSFVPSPPWLSRLRGDKIGRLHRTGDLVQYMVDGRIRYVGRKDRQVKLHGQRIELGEVEANLKQFFCDSARIVVELVHSPDSRARLVAFISLRETGAAISGTDDKPLFAATDDAFRDICHEAKSRLPGILPRYMVPSLFVQLNYVPLTASGKVHRRMISQLAMSLPSDGVGGRLRSNAAVTVKPVNDKERVVSELWAGLLNLQVSDVSTTDDFFAMGGDSIVAMRLASAAREKGYLLSVADVFSHPRLSDMAAVAKSGVPAQDSFSPFELVHREKRASLLEVAARACQVNNCQVEDVYPCTPLQEAMIYQSLRNAGAFQAQFRYRLPDDIDVESLKRAWTAVVKANPILRTSIIQHSALYQVVLDDDIPLRVIHGGSLKTLASTMTCKMLQLGQPMLQLFFWHGENLHGSGELLLDIHHALYDGWSLGLILDQLERAYSGAALAHQPFNKFIGYASKADNEAGRKYWLGQLADVFDAPFPLLPSNDYSPVVDSCTDIGFQMHPTRGHTSATALKLAWAMVLSQYSESSETVFGLVTSGRNASIDGIEHICGPTITTVPFYFRPRRSQTVADELIRVREQLAHMAPHEQFGLHSIRKLGGNADNACRFQTLLLIHHSTVTRSGRLLVPLEDEVNAADFSTYALEVTCRVSDEEAAVTFHFDSKVLVVDQVRRLAAQLAHVTQQIQENLTENVANLNLLAPASREEIEVWNSGPAEAVNRCVHHVIEAQCLHTPDEQAVCAWDGDLSYGELNDLSSGLASHLQALGIGPEVFVPILSEKSKWVAVGILAVIKAGGAVALLDPALPLQRLRTICNALGAQVVVSSDACKDIASQLASTLAVLGSDCCETASTVNLSQEVGPLNALYAIFTSGSTGEPKGIITEHAAFYTSGLTQRAHLYLDGDTRTLQFASHMFDVSIADYLWTFLAGGCVCVPSSESLRDNLAGVINHFGVNRVDLTPSIARTLRPQDVPSIKTVLLGGESMNQHDIETWAGKVRLVNGYGPSECSVCCALADVTPDSEPANIGRTYGATSWIVDKDNHEALLPVGAVGELLVEGPALARGYLNDAARTAKAFIEAPRWLAGIRPRSRVYKTGDLVRYNSDGTLKYVGRKDTQVKIRGQRVELEEIEHQILRADSSVANAIVEIVKPVYRGAGEILVAFIRQERVSDETTNEYPLLPSSGQYRESAQHLAVELKRYLPAYMMPNVFISLGHVPLTIAGKTDRRLLRHLAANMTWQQLRQYQPGKALRRAPSTAEEKKLQEVVADVLVLNLADVGMDDDFFRLGGDSIDAIRLAHDARKRGFTFRVTDIFRTPRISDLALFKPDSDGCGVECTAPETAGSMSSKTVGLASKSDLVPLLKGHQSGRFAEENIVDVLPVTQAAERYLFQAPEYWIVNFTGAVDQDKLHAACSALVSRHGILRTIFVEHGGKYHQVVVDGIEVLVKRFSTLLSMASFVDGQRQRDTIVIPTLGIPVTQFWFVEGKEGDKALVVRLSHAQFDGYSLHILWRDLKLLYEGAALPPASSYSTHLKLWDEASTEEAFSFWRETLQGSSISRIDNASFGDTSCSDSGFSTASRVVDVTNNAPSSITIATVVKVAWSIVLASISGRHDVVFAQTSSGRSHGSSTAKDVVGMCLNFIPVRVRLDPAATVADLLAFVQEQHRRSLDHELLDFRDVVRNATSWPEGICCQSNLVHQNIEPDLPFAFGEAEALVTCSYDWPRPPDEILVESRPLQDGQMQVTLDTRSDLLTRKNAEVVLENLCKVITSILGDTGSERVGTFLAAVDVSSSH